ncbi:hypothetical protein [Rhizobium leguminosarum]|uniref:hypothetical protein n=1 Tax=Rhizobium leguminosarum TaxID=384 RepID=UPI001C965E77|nr:hypothetical protein [Rhizobium leguminosarum]MBY5378924.1 hypothetical protein [Rhizobium leguminosarum]
MLCTLQVPVIDLRRFFKDEAPLVRPDWLLPQVDTEFLRTFGALRQRPLGGLSGWVGEGIVCRASRAVTFPEGLVSTQFGRQAWRVWGVNKTFFHDGTAVAKLEISYKISRNSPKAASVNNVVSAMLERPVRIPGHADRRELKLGQIGKAIASKFLDASSSKEARARSRPRDLVIAGRPCIFIQHTSRKTGNIPPHAREFILPVEYVETLWGLRQGKAAGIRVFYWRVDFQGQRVPVFYCQHNDAGKVGARNLRIYLSRMWTEIECLAGCLRAISKGTLVVDPRGREAQELQNYINNAIKRIKRLGNNSSKIVGHDIYDIGYAVFETFNEEDLTRLETALNVLEFRRNVIRAVKDMGTGHTPSTVIFTQGVYMAEKNYNFGAGSQLNEIQPGANATISGPDNRTQTQIVNNTLSGLSVELEQLVLDAIQSGKLSRDGIEHQSTKEIVLEAQKSEPSATKILGALGTIEGALSHVSGIGEKINAIADLIKSVL